MQLQLIEYEADETGDDLELVEDTENLPDESPDDSEECLQISLHAMQGCAGVVSMRIQGYVRRRRVQILIDNGASHGYLDYSLACRLGWKGDSNYEGEVEVVGGIKLKLFGI